MTIILLSPGMFERYGTEAGKGPIHLDNPGLVPIPLSVLTLVVVSLLTQDKKVKGGSVE